MKITVCGLIGNIAFHQAILYAQDLHEMQKNKFEPPEINAMLEMVWKEYTVEKIKELQGTMWSYKNNELVFIDNAVIGSSENFYKWANQNFGYLDYRPLPLYVTIAEDSYKNHFINSKRVYVRMEISIGGEVSGSLLIELFSDILPKTCENFRALCTGENGVSHHNSVESFSLHYLNSIFHRIVPGGWIQGGDIWYGRGSGGESIYGPTFEDENFKISHNKRGVLTMANRGRHSNQSQFCILFSPCEWMDTKNVAFGQVVEGNDLLSKMETVTTINQRPIKDVCISNCNQAFPALNECQFEN